MYTEHDIYVGSRYHNPDPDDSFDCEVIGINCGGQFGHTELRIISSKRPEMQWFRPGTVFRELAFIKHWNTGHYILTFMNGSQVTAKSRIAFL